jgi:hypothetical protein
MDQGIERLNRRSFVGGSDARIIMGSDESALLRLCQEKRGEIEPEDLSGNLIVQLGLVTEALNRNWYERNTGQTVECVQHRLRHPVLRWMGKTVRLRDKDHRKFVLRQACLVCGRVPSDPHHLTFTQPRALGHRVSDELTVPVCRIHHRELHRSGDEAAWWQKLNIDPLPVALRLWQHTRADGELAAIREGMTQAQAAKTPDMSVQDRAGTNLDQCADAGNSASKKLDDA